MSKQPTRLDCLPLGFTRQQAARLQRILDTEGRRPADLADEWGVSVSAANHDVARMRAKAGASTMAELLARALRAGIITVSRVADACPKPRGAADGPAKFEAGSSPNVYCRALADGLAWSYNVPILPITGFSRTGMQDWEEQTMSEQPPEVNELQHIVNPTGRRRGYLRVDDPGLLAECDARRDRNNAAAAAAGLPAVGARMVNRHGIEWVVESHVYGPTPGTAQRWRDHRSDQPADLYPSVVPTNLSRRLTDLMLAVDRCTAKTLLLLDTTPELRRTAIPGSNWLDTIANAGANLAFLDVARLHETTLAHEIGHAWVQYVEQCEDERVMADVSCVPRLHQLSLVQSFVLDLKVNDLLRRRGFDVRPIEVDEAAGLTALTRAIEMGYRPPNRREEVFVALLLATGLVGVAHAEAEMPEHLHRGLGALRRLSSNVADLAEELAAVVIANGYGDRDSVRLSVDGCLRLAFSHTGDGIDLVADLTTPGVEEPEFDKYPQWLPGAPVRLKTEVGRVMARENVPEGSSVTVVCRASTATAVSFDLPDGSRRGPFVLGARWLPPHHLASRALMEASRRTQERATGPGRLHPQSTTGTRNKAAFALPSGPQVSVPPRRLYMAGLGRFLTRARLDEQLAGKHPYAYAECSPVTNRDPNHAQSTMSMSPDTPPWLGASTVIDAVTCRTACDTVYAGQKGKLVRNRKLCNEICRMLKHASCPGLLALCNHLRRMGLSGIKYYEICTDLYAVLCTTGDDAYLCSDQAARRHAAIQGNGTEPPARIYTARHGGCCTRGQLN